MDHCAILGQSRNLLARCTNKSLKKDGVTRNEIAFQRCGGWEAICVIDLCFVEGLNAHIHG